MAHRNTLDPDKVINPDRGPQLKGHDVRSLGPSDSSDSGSDMLGPDLGTDDTSDRSGTGEHMGAPEEPNVRDGSDIAPDRIVGAEEAGLGGGLDQAEEAQLGVTDEELAARARRRLGGH